MLPSPLTMPLLPRAHLPATLQACRLLWMNWATGCEEPSKLDLRWTPKLNSRQGYFPRQPLAKDLMTVNRCLLHQPSQQLEVPGDTETPLPKPDPGATMHC